MNKLNKNTKAMKLVDFYLHICLQGIHKTLPPLNFLNKKDFDSKQVVFDASESFTNVKLVTK